MRSILSGNLSTQPVYSSFYVHHWDRPKAYESGTICCFAFTAFGMAATFLFMKQVNIKEYTSEKDGIVQKKYKSYNMV